MGVVYPGYMLIPLVELLVCVGLTILHNSISKMESKPPGQILTISKPGLELDLGRDFGDKCQAEHALGSAMTCWDEGTCRGPWGVGLSSVDCISSDLHYKLHHPASP